MALDETTKERIILLRSHGVAYARIARHLELNANSVKTFCLRNNITTNHNVEELLIRWVCGACSVVNGLPCVWGRSFAVRSADVPGGKPTATVADQRIPRRVLSVGWRLRCMRRWRVSFAPTRALSNTALAHGVVGNEPGC